MTAAIVCTLALVFVLVLVVWAINYTVDCPQCGGDMDTDFSGYTTHYHCTHCNYGYSSDE